MSAPTFEYDPKTKTLTCWVTPEEYWSMMETRAPHENEPDTETWQKIKEAFKAHIAKHGRITLKIATVHLGADAMKHARKGTSCPNDTDGDGDCHLCAKTGRCQWPSISI